jgi:hypothetical protein
MYVHNNLVIQSIGIYQVLLKNVKECFDKKSTNVFIVVKDA